LVFAVTAKNPRPVRAKIDYKNMAKSVRFEAFGESRYIHHTLLGRFL